MSGQAAETRPGSIAVSDGLIVLVAALTARILVRLSGEGSMFFNRISDSFIYENWARAINGRADSALTDGAYFLGPLYPHLLALLDTGITSTLNLQTALGGLTALCCWLCAALIYDRKAGLAAGMLVACYKPFIFYENLLLPETGLIFFCAAGLVLLQIYRTHRYLLALAVAGLFFGLACLSKGIILPAALAVGMIIFSDWPQKLKIKGNFKRRIIATTSFFAPLFALLLFPAIHNFSAGEPVVLSANGGLNFYLGNNREATGDYEKPYWLDLTKDFTGREFAHRKSGKELTLKESSNYYYRQAWNEIFNNPGRWSLLLLRKTMLALHGREVPQAENIYYAAHLKPALGLPWLGWSLLFPLALAGLLFDGGRRRETLPHWLLALSVITISIVFFAVARFRLPAALALTIPAGAAIATGITAFKEKRYKAAVIFGAAIALAAVLLQIPYSGGRRNDDLTQGELTHAGYFMMQGDFDEAIAHAEQALNLSPNNPWAYSIRGLAYSRQGEKSMAIESLRQALDLQPNNAAFATNLALTYLRANDFMQAEVFAERASLLDPNSEKARKILDVIKQKTGR